jgi:hypothetical protein
MKKFFIIACMVALLPMFVGCKTVTPSQMQTTVNLMNTVVPIGVEYAVYKDASTVPYFRAAADAVELVASGTNFNPAVLIEDLNKIPQTSTLEARLAVTAGVGIYATFFAEQVGNDANAVLILHTLSTDIHRGLGDATAKVHYKTYRAHK